MQKAGFSHNEAQIGLFAFSVFLHILVLRAGFEFCVNRFLVIVSLLLDNFFASRVEQDETGNHYENTTM